MNEDEAPIVRIAEALESIAKSLDRLSYPQTEVAQNPMAFCDGYWKKATAE